MEKNVMATRRVNLTAFLELKGKKRHSFLEILYHFVGNVFK